MPEFLGKRFDERSRVYFSIISILISILIDIAGALFASSVLLKGIFPDIELYVFVIIMAIITGLYTVTGGLRAVVVTDTIQAVLLSLGCTIIAIAAFVQAGSWSDITNAIDPSFLSLIQPTDDPLIPWPTLILSLPILGFYFMCTNQHMVQRVLGAKSVEDGRKGAIFAGLLKLPLLFILIFPGTIAILHYPELENPNLVFAELMFDLIPPGVLGVVLAGFIAALMSSIDSALTASSSIATMDLYKKIKPNSSQRQLIKVGKICIISAVTIASIWAPFINKFPTLWEYLQAALSFLCPPVVTCYLFGLFWKKATSKAAFYSLVSGSITGLFLIINNYFFSIFPPVHYLYSATVIFVMSSLIMLTVSLFEPEEELSVFFKEKNDPIKIEPSPWFKSYKLFALIVFILTFLLVYWYW